MGTGNTSRERLPLRRSPPEPQLIPIPISDGEDDQPPHEERQRERSRSHERVYPHVQVPQVPQIQPRVTPEPDDDVSDEDFTAVNPPSPSARPPSAEQRGRSRRDEISRSRERVPPHPSSPQEQEDSWRQSPQKQKGKKIVAEKQPSESPNAKKHKFMDSDEDDEEPHNEPGTFSNSQPTVPVLIRRDQQPV